MKKIRVIVCVAFVITCAVFALYIFKTKLTQDITPPTITADSGELSVSVSANEEELLSGITAYDDVDGDITDSVRVSSVSRFLEPDVRTVTYVVFDSSNNPAVYERNIRYTDYAPPRITSEHPIRYTSKEISTTEFKKYIKAVDSVDGDISDRIRVEYGEDYYYGEADAFTMVLQVSNSAGDSVSVPVEVNAAESAGKKIYPELSDYIVYTDGDKLDFESYLIGTNQNGEVEKFDADGRSGDIEKGDISIKSDVNYSEAGVYTVEYSCTSDGEKAITKLYVVVEKNDR